MKRIKLFENFDQKKQYGFTFVSRDFKESMSNVMPNCKKIVKKYGDGWDFDDVETGWNDDIYTVITNYPDPQKLVDDLGEDLFYGFEGTDEVVDDILWFNTEEELKQIVEAGVKLLNDESEEEDKDFEELEAKLGRAEYEKRRNEKIQELKDLGWSNDYKKVLEKVDAPHRQGGWSMSSLAIYLLLREEGLRK